MYFTDINYLKDFMDAHKFPEEAKVCLQSNFAKIIEDPTYNARFESICDDYMHPDTQEVRKALETLKILSEDSGVHKYTMDLLFWICCSKKLLEKYREQGIDEQIFFDSMEDLRCKLLECMKREEICGTFVDWFNGFYHLKRFALGRFQYDMHTSTLDEDYVLPDGTVIKAGIPTLNIHIPSSGVPLTDEIRFDSYRKAYAFFQNYYPSDYVVLECSSWLLYDKHLEFLPKNSNILNFMNDFDIIENTEKDGFGSAWRVFGKNSNLPYEQLPENTSLQKAYKNWLIKTGKSGSGHGIIVFDGEKIINKK